MKGFDPRIVLHKEFSSQGKLATPDQGPTIFRVPKLRTITELLP